MSLMPWQRQVLETALEINPQTNRLAYRDVTLTVPRQSGKTSTVLILMLIRALAAPRQNIRYTAQTGMDARKKWMDDWLPILESSKLSSQFNVRRANGHEALLFKNGSLQGLVATTKKTGHGGTLDLAILDESFAHPDSRLEQALKPAMITRPQPQFWVISTAGTFEDSPYLLEKVEMGRELASRGVTDGTAYFEWSAEEDADPADPITWRSCMPALGITVTEEAVASDFASMTLSEFRRAYLNQWVLAIADPIIPITTWMGLIDASSEANDPVCFAFDGTPDRSTASIAAAGIRPDGRSHIEVIDHRSGFGWVVDRLVGLQASHKPKMILCDPASSVGSLIPELKQRGVEVVEIGPAEHAKACGLIYDSAINGDMRHLGTTELVTALEGAAKRRLGDAWAWSRRSSTVDISPLVAATLALWGTRAREAVGVPEVYDLNEIVERLRTEQEPQAAMPGPSSPPPPPNRREVTFHAF